MSIAVRGLADVQAGAEPRNVALDEVGVAGLTLPLRIGGGESPQATVGVAEFTVSVAADVRGTHMSRFVELLSDLPSLDAEAVLETTRLARSRLDAERAKLVLKFPLFFLRTAPESGIAATLRYNASFCAIVDGATDVIWLGVDVPVTSLCPCSKEIADYGAHSQRGRVRIELRPVGTTTMSFVDLFHVADNAGSSPIYSLLKRPDERAVTMAAYDNPRFVEDMAREVAVALRADPRVVEFQVEVENQESIHDHQAVARLAWRKV